MAPTDRDRALGPRLGCRLPACSPWGFLARAQGLHEAVVAAIKADNPYAAFTLLRPYAENAAAILYMTDKPETLERFWRGEPHVAIGRITNLFDPGKD